MNFFLNLLVQCGYTCKITGRIPVPGKYQGRLRNGIAALLRGLSPRANYTDRAAAAGRRS